MLGTPANFRPVDTSGVKKMARGWVTESPPTAIPLGFRVFHPGSQVAHPGPLGPINAPLRIP